MAVIVRKKQTDKRAYDRPPDRGTMITAEKTGYEDDDVAMITPRGVRGDDGGQRRRQTGGATLRCRNTCGASARAFSNPPRVSPPPPSRVSVVVVVVAHARARSRDNSVSAYDYNLIARVYTPTTSLHRSFPGRIHGYRLGATDAVTDPRFHPSYPPAVDTRRYTCNTTQRALNTVRTLPISRVYPFAE